MHTYLDIIILIIAVILSAMGAKRGFISELFRLAAMIVGFFTGYIYHKDLQKFLEFIEIPSQITAIFSFLLIFLVTAFSILGLGWVLRKAIHLTLLGWGDRMLGAVLGLLKTALIAWVTCLSLSSIPSPATQTALNNSIVYRLYSTLPRSFSFHGMEEKRLKIRYLFNKEKQEELRQSISGKNTT